MTSHRRIGVAVHLFKVHALFGRERCRGISVLRRRCIGRGKIAHRPVRLCLGAFGTELRCERLAREIHHRPRNDLFERLVGLIGIRIALIVAFNIILFIRRAARRESLRAVHYDVCSRCIVFQLEVVRSVYIVTVDNKHLYAVRNAPEFSELLHGAVYAVGRGGIHPDDKCLTGLYRAVRTRGVHRAFRRRVFPVCIVGGIGSVYPVRAGIDRCITLDRPLKEIGAFCGGCALISDHVVIYI